MIPTYHTAARTTPRSLPVSTGPRTRIGAALACLTLAFAATSLPISAQVATFSDVTLNSSYSGGGSYFNGGPVTNSDGFDSGGIHFSNTYSSDFGGYWSGFAASTATDTTTAGYGNQYSAITGAGAGDAAYGIAFTGYADAVINLPANATAPLAISVTNTTYAYLSMRDGDAFAKQFGGASGDDPDFLLLTITARDAANAVMGTVDFYLADFRFSDNSLDYIVNTWTSVDLSSFGSGVRTLQLTMDSSDVGAFGPNTPVYVAIDNLVVVPEPGTVALLAGLAILGIASRLRRRQE